MTRPTVSHNQVVRFTASRRNVCSLCGTPLPLGGWAWLIEVPGRRITRDGRCYSIKLTELWCDACEKKGQRP